MESTCHSCHREARPAVAPPNRRLLIVLGIFLAIFATSFLPALSALNESLIEYLSVVWWAVLLGLLLGGVIDYFVPDGFVVRFLGTPRRITLLYAVVAGLLMSACSHGILAIAMQLYKKGASVPAVIAFLLASPWSNLPITILLFSFFGLKAFLIVGGAMLIALTTGAVYMLLDRLGWIEGSSSAADVNAVSWSNLLEFDAGRAAQGVAAGSMSLANMVLWWILIGILAAAFIGAFVPAHWFMEYLGPDFAGMGLTLLGATVIEVCSEGTSPIAFEIHDRLGVLGNPFLFLMAGVVTDYTEIGLLWSTIGRRTALWLPVVAVPQVFLLAWVFNKL